MAPLVGVITISMSRCSFRHFAAASVAACRLLFAAGAVDATAVNTAVITTAYVVVSAAAAATANAPISAAVNKSRE